jgi:pimeloyl-ACP methyl ester carboxylesterase
MLVVVCLLAVVAACGRGGEGAKVDDAKAVRHSDVTFKTSDGRTLTGRLFGSGKVGVTLAHMYPADATSWYPAAERIAEAGYMTLAFNFRGFGSSGGTKQILQAPVDVDAAKDYLQKRGARNVAYIGASMGGTASIIAGDKQEPLAIVAISAPTRFMGLDAPLAATAVQRPVLLMASRDDDDAFESLKEFESALPNPEDTKIYDGDAHGTNLLEARPEAVDEIIEFLKRYAPLSLSAPQPS